MLLDILHTNGFMYDSEIRLEGGGGGRGWRTQRQLMVFHFTLTKGYYFRDEVDMCLIWVESGRRTI